MKLLDSHSVYHDGMLDHLLWAVPDLGTGRQDLARRTGVTAAIGGRHLGVGTHNALLDLSAERYLEIIALDPTQRERSGLGLLLEHVHQSTLLTWCARSDDLEATAAAVRRAGMTTEGPIAMSRQRPDGTKLEWRLLFPQDHTFGLLMPFFIEWGPTTPHPSQSAPAGLRMSRFVLHHPEPEILRHAFREFGLEVDIESAASPGLTAELETHRGPVSLSSIR